jgi:hypothetical protein
MRLLPLQQSRDERGNWLGVVYAKKRSSQG